VSRLRRATAADVATVARLFREVRTTCLPYLPTLHTPQQDLWFFRDRVFVACEVWLAGAEAVDGFCALRPGWVDHLYVRAERQGQAVGSALLGLAMSRCRRLRLYAFQRNTPAIRFYQARGFRRIDETDGSRNEELEPDALFEWVRPSEAAGRPGEPAWLA